MEHQDRLDTRNVAVDDERQVAADSRDPQRDQALHAEGREHETRREETKSVKGSHSPRSGFEQLLLRAVLTCTDNRLFGDGAAERPAGDDVTAVVDAGPDARLGCFRGKGV